MNKVIVTGALGYSGKVITEKLLEQGYIVKTLTNSLQRTNPFGNKIEVAPFNFNQKDKLIKSMETFDTLINTYWVRFNHKKFNHSDAVTNTKILFDSAKTAGIKRIIHVSITNPNINSDLEYFRGKGILEEYLETLSLPFSIVRPAVLFGRDDILINNIAWMIRHLPVFGVFGDGSYKLQPIHIDDFAQIIIEEAKLSDNRYINAIGPETYTYKMLCQTIMDILGIKKNIISVSPYIGYLAGKLISNMKGDVTITREEIKGLMDNLLYVDDLPMGNKKLSEYIQTNKDRIGKIYANELSRR